METVSCRPSEGDTSTKRKLDDVLMPVSPGASGKGLPYAAVDWPNPGDVWGWKVGKRIKRNGFFRDRYLMVPESLQPRPNMQMWLLSKLEVANFIRAKFPNADINAFFASFTWEISANTTSQRTAKFASSSKSFRSQKVKHGLERADGVYRRTRKSVQQLKSEKSTDKFLVVIDMSSEKGGGALSSDTNISVSKNGEASNSPAATSSNAGVFRSPICREFDYLETLQESKAAMTAEEFDKYVDTLDEILSLHLPRYQTSCLTEETIAAREKLSSLLALDFPNLISSDKLNELVACVSKLQNEPYLSPQELSMIKLLQEIPLMRKCFLEAKETLNKADKFFADLDTKIAFAGSLKKEYIKSKEEIEVLQAEEASVLLSMMETDEQIAALQSYRTSLTQAIKMTNKKIVQHTSSQKRVMDSLPNIVHDIQEAKSKRAEWELKKKKSAAKEAEILEKFAPLKGFSF